MANDKMTWVELRKAVAQAANTTEQEADMFLNALLAEITNGLRTDKQVKVKGIGTFSLKWVAPRKSVNIATGEAFVIDGYSKLTFSAESTLKESVEKRIERPKTDDIMADFGQDPMRKLGEQADEIVDILADLGQSPKVKKTEQPQEPTSQDDLRQEDTQDTSTEEFIALTAEESQEEHNEEAPLEEQPTPAPEILNDNKPTTEGAVQNIPPFATETSTPTPRRKSSVWIGWVAASVLLLVLVGTGFYFRNTLQMWWQCLRDCQPVEITEVVPVAEPVEIEKTDVPAVIPLAEQPRKYTRFIGTERVGVGSRLAWISYKYYGVKDLWVFIYEANKDQIRHPNHLEYGKVICVPLLSEKLMNLSDPETRQLIDNLQKEYLNQ